MSSVGSRSNAHRRTRAGITLLEVLLVMAILALMAGITYPSVSSGLDAIRIRTAADSTASFLTSCMARVERRQHPIEITFFLNSRKMEARGNGPAVLESVELPDGVSIVGTVPPLMLAPEAPRSILLLPGAPFPAMGIEVANRRGARRLIRIDPAAGVPVVQQPGPPQ
jgi:prepilin-type N-terminal cleavage/methylation domain-containing protein